MPLFDPEKMIKLVSELRKIDICNHLISRNGFRVPEDYGNTFMVMGEVGALDMDFADELKVNGN